MTFSYHLLWLAPLLWYDGKYVRPDMSLRSSWHSSLLLSVKVVCEWHEMAKSVCTFTFLTFQMAFCTGRHQNVEVLIITTNELMKMWKKTTVEKKINVCLTATCSWLIYTCPRACTMILRLKLSSDMTLQATREAERDRPKGKEENKDIFPQAPTT